jgi:hypothetical protein
MEVFEYVGRNFAIRDNLDQTKRFQGIGNQRREREKQEECNPSLFRTQEPQRLRWRHGYKNLRRRITAGEATSKAPDAETAASSAPPRPPAATPLHLWATHRLSLQGAILRPLQLTNAAQLQKVRLHQEMLEATMEMINGHSSKARSSRTHPFSAPVGEGKWPENGRNEKSTVGNSKGLQCSQIVWVQQGKNAGKRGTILPKRRIPGWKMKWFSGVVK